MYNPPAFKVDKFEDLQKHISLFPLGITISCHGQEIHTSYVPFILRENKLEGHLTLFNDHVKILEQTNKVTVVFPGTNGYISPDWYTTNNLAPTWNFITAHITGTPCILHNDQELVEVLNRQISAYEDSVEGEWSISKLEKKAAERLLKNIVAICIDIESFELKYKLSQNRSQEDINSVIQSLQNAYTKPPTMENLMRKATK